MYGGHHVLPPDEVAKDPHVEPAAWRGFLVVGKCGRDVVAHRDRSECVNHWSEEFIRYVMLLELQKELRCCVRVAKVR